MAKAILGVMFSGLLALAAWAGNSVIRNQVAIRGLEVSKKAMHEDIKEIKQDVKSLLRREK